MLTALDANPDDLDEGDKKVVANIREHGWFRTAVFAEGDEPGFAYTTGFWVSAGVPEIIAFSIKVEPVHRIFWGLFNDAKVGNFPAPGKRSTEIIDNLPAYLFPVDKRHYREFLGWSRWFYAGNDFPCLQLVWPDRSGIFPWEPGFDESFRADQPDLTEKGWLATIKD